MRQFEPARSAMKALAVAGALMCGCAGAQAQQDWFRPPASVGQPTRQQPQQARPQTRQQQQQRQQQAQPQPQQRQWNPLFPLFELFRTPPPPRYAAPQPQPETEARPRKAVQIEQPAEPRGTVFTSIEDARKDRAEPPSDVVLVIGDEFAGPLAQGLADAFAPEREGVVVIGKGQSASGLMPGGDPDWVAAAPELSRSQSATAIVAFLGSNDLHPITDATGKAELFDERWLDIYGRRLDEFLAGLKAQGRPVAIVGLPPVDDSRASGRNIRFNELLKERTERAGLIYVDVWDGFVDENGKFFLSGPAVDGQRRRLRTSDGAGFTRAGGRKLAFFVDRAIGKLLNGEPGAVAPGADGSTPSGGPPAIIQLTGGAAGGARTLAGAKIEPPRPSLASDALATRVLVGGEPLAPVEGRVDDFRWQPPGSAAPAAAAPSSTAPPADGAAAVAPSPEGAPPAP